MDFIVQNAMERFKPEEVNMSRKHYLSLLSAKYCNKPNGQFLVKDNEIIYRPKNIFRGE